MYYFLLVFSKKFPQNFPKILSISKIFSYYFKKQRAVT
nr:MAG TPA: hypothetical protein [Caudoviricetes sp.]